VKKGRQGNREATRVREVIRSLKALDSEIEKRVFPKKRSVFADEQLSWKRDIHSNDNEFQD
jgi:hypothetical protein